MFPSFLLSLREGLEAALLIGIVLGTLRKLNQPQLRPAVWAGTISALVVSLLAAWGLNLLGAQFEGRAEEVFEGVTMLLAAGVLTWMIFWMNRKGREIEAELEQDVRRAAGGEGKWALFSLAFLASGMSAGPKLYALVFSSLVTRSYLARALRMENPLLLWIPMDLQMAVKPMSASAFWPRQTRICAACSTAGDVGL